MNVKNWVPISIIILFASGFAAWAVSDYAAKPLFWQIWAVLCIGGFGIMAVIGFFGQSKK